nr:hypothetical protein BaRGS_002553 [Batillaria attramentaria]
MDFFISGKVVEGLERSPGSGMEYSPKDSTMRIFGVARPNTYMNKVTKKAQGQIPASHLREIENHAPGQNHVDTSNIKTEPQLQSPREQNHAAQTRVQVKTEKQFQAPSNTGHHGSENVVPSVDLSSLQPDERGWFSLCFPESKAPNVESLEDLFGEAGPVKAVHRGAGYIFIRYDTPEAVQRAFQLFGFLDLRLGYNRKSKNTPAGSNASNKRQYPQHTSHQNEAEVRTYKYMADPSRVRIAQDHSGETKQGEMRTRSLSEKSSVAESPPSATYAGSEPDQFSTELFLGNIPNDRECTKEMVKELFQPYNLVHLYWKRSKKKTFAFALLHSRRDAEEAMQKLNGYDLMGRPLKIRISDIKVASRVGEIKSPKTAALPRTSKGKLFDHITEYGLMPDLEEDMPDLEEDSSDEGSTAGTEILRRRYDVVPNPEITRQVIASGGYSLHITRRVDPTHSTQGDFGSEVIRRMGPQPGNSGDAGSVMQQRVDTRAKYNVEEETEEPCILVANFRKDTTKEELRALFFRYHPQHVEIISSPKCTKAMIKLATVADVKAAVAEMNQEAYMGQRLLVDVPFQCPLLRAAVLGPEAVGKKAPDKIAPSEVLKAHVRIMATLKAKEPKVLLGERIEVLVTCAITDSFLWGQIDTDSRQRLKHIMTELNMNPDKREDRATGPGPCKALFDGDGQWYRSVLSVM